MNSNSCLATDDFLQSLNSYAANPVFANVEDWFIDDNPYRRPVRPAVLKYQNFEKCLRKNDYNNYSALAAHRLLTNIYESAFVYLPRRHLAKTKADFDLFYADQTLILGETLRPTLERHVFGYLENEISLAGGWTKNIFKDYFQAQFVGAKDNLCPLIKTVYKSSHKEIAAQFLMIQFAVDFLSEASAMVSQARGSFGPIQSDLFKIIIDEFGYGVDATKHSTLFEQTLTACGLKPEIHTYWQFYLVTSLALNNYFHYLARDPKKIFRYLGALAYTEGNFEYLCAQMSEMLENVFGENAVTHYFDEHAHIDRFHGQTAFNDILLKAIDTYGEAVIPEMVKGIEELRLLCEQAERDFNSQITWCDDKVYYQEMASPILKRIKNGELKFPILSLDEPRHELSVTHVHDGDELCIVESGLLEFRHGFGHHVMLKAGDCTLIRKNRLHGALVHSERCVYHIHSIGDHTQCL